MVLLGSVSSSNSARILSPMRVYTVAHRLLLFLLCLGYFFLTFSIQCTVADTKPSVFHTCIHDKESIRKPLAELPKARVQLFEKKFSSAREASFFSRQAVTSSGRNASEVKGAHVHSQNTSTLKREERENEFIATSNEGRNLKFLIVSLLNISCTEVGQLTTTYTGGIVKCREADVLTSRKKQFIQKIVDEASQRLSLSLKAIPIERIDVRKDVCSGLNTESFSADDADFVLFLTSSPIEDGGNTVAWARSCAREYVTIAGRPVVGQVNFITSSANEHGLVSDRDITLAMHEISHALGFDSIASTLWNYYDLEGVWHFRGGTETKYLPGRGKTVHLVKTPRVVAAARKHFGCSDLDGVEIEDLGGSGTAGSHWKKRIFYQEALVGVISTPTLYYSSVTLAFFEDAGFYQAQYEYASDGYSWGYQRGCEFLTHSCRYLFDKGIGNEFCFPSDGEVKATSNEMVCSLDHQGVGRCDIGLYTKDLPKEYQYFPDHPRLGGQATMDYCPVTTFYQNFDCVNPYLNPLTNLFGAEFGPGSRCLSSSVVTHSFPLFVQSKQPQCYKTSCIYRETDGVVSGQLLISVQGQTAPCPADGKAGVADTSGLRGVHGVIDCPSASDICFPSKPYNATTALGALQLPPKFTPPWTRGTSCTKRLEFLHVGNFNGAPETVCASLIRRAQRSGGEDCVSDLSRWFQKELKVSPKNCWKRSKTNIIPRCADGWEGAQRICTFLSSS